MRQESFRWMVANVITFYFTASSPIFAAAAPDSTIPNMPLPSVTSYVLLAHPALDTANCVWSTTGVSTTGDAFGNGPLTLSGCLGGLVGACTVGNLMDTGAASEIDCPQGMVQVSVFVRFFNNAGAQASLLYYFDQRTKIQCCPLTVTYTWSPLPPPCSSTVTSNCITP
jgi:hypothetical protein